jgi:hypothetical protein
MNSLRLASTNPDITLDAVITDHRKRGGSEQAQSKSAGPLIALQAVGGMPPIAGDELV